MDVDIMIITVAAIRTAAADVASLALSIEAIQVDGRNESHDV